MKKVDVRLGERSYPIYIGHQSLTQLGRLIAQHHLSGTACVVSQKEIWSRWGKKLRTVLDDAHIPVKLHLTANQKRSEQSKSIKELLRIITACSKTDAKAKGLYLIALGGGVIGDVTGFAASIYRRGTPYIQIPTTLTAQVDSAIGGKTAVDLPHGKNLLGSIFQPRLVLVDPDFLSTLGEHEYRDGLAEIVKYALIEDRPLFRRLEKNVSQILNRDRKLLTQIIASCAKIKARIVSRDEFDKKEIRMVLNLGHTVGHAIEAAASYRSYTHGQAVAVGMTIALEISDALSYLKDVSILRRVDQLLSDLGLPIMLDRRTPIRKVMEAMKFDKKNLNGVNRFVLVKDVGRCVIHRDVPAQVIYDQIIKRSR